jgi:hypothetical protein
MMHKQRLVEARVIARCILENQFWATCFADDPDRFRQALIDQDLNKKGSSGEMLFAGGGLLDEIDQQLREWLRANKGWKQSKAIAPKHVAKDAGLSDAYLFYDVLSSDAHPTVHALNRYVTSADGKSITGIDLDPVLAEEELIDTIGLSCYGLLGVLVSACTLLRSEAAGRLDLLAQEYLALMKAKVEGVQAARS